MLGAAEAGGVGLLWPDGMTLDLLLADDDEDKLMTLFLLPPGRAEQNRLFHMCDDYTGCIKINSAHKKK